MVVAASPLFVPAGSKSVAGKLLGDFKLLFTTTSGIQVKLQINVTYRGHTNGTDHALKEDKEKFIKGRENKEHRRAELEREAISIMIENETSHPAYDGYRIGRKLFPPPTEAINTSQEPAKDRPKSEDEKQPTAPEKEAKDGTAKDQVTDESKKEETDKDVEKAPFVIREGFYTTLTPGTAVTYLTVKATYGAFLSTMSVSDWIKGYNVMGDNSCSAENIHTYLVGAMVKLEVHGVGSAVWKIEQLGFGKLKDAPTGTIGEKGSANVYQYTRRATVLERLKRSESSRQPFMTCGYLSDSL